MADMTSMEITDFFFSRRENALLAGDHNSYRAQSSRRLHTVRKKLGQTTPRGRKYAAKPQITAQNVGSNQEYVQRKALFAVD
jgi:signal recognition particle subunit SRP68